MNKGKNNNLMLHNVTTQTLLMTHEKKNGEKDWQKNDITLGKDGTISFQNTKQNISMYMDQIWLLRSEWSVLLFGLRFITATHYILEKSVHMIENQRRSRQTLNVKRLGAFV